MAVVKIEKAEWWVEDIWEKVVLVIKEESGFLRGSKEKDITWGEIAKGTISCRC